MMTPSNHEIEHALASIEAATGPSLERERLYWYQQEREMFARYSTERDRRIAADRRAARNGWFLLVSIVIAGLSLLAGGWR
jgi:hypothetical protein